MKEGGGGVGCGKSALRPRGALCCSREMSSHARRGCGVVWPVEGGRASNCVLLRGGLFSVAGGSSGGGRLPLAVSLCNV